MQAALEKTEQKSVKTAEPMPSIEQWIQTGLFNGQSKTSLFNLMVKSGWNPDLASKTLELSTPERRQVGFLAPTVGVLQSQASKKTVDTSEADKQAIALKVVPRPLIDSSGQFVDAGGQLVKVLHHRQAPDLVHFEDFLSTEECDQLIAFSLPKLERSMTVNNSTGGSYVNADRTSFGAHLKRDENELVALIEQRIAKLVSWPLTHGEGLQILRYLPGAEYKPHHDYFDPHQPGSAVIVRQGGNRVGTFLMYLNTPEEGGETVFPDVGLAVAPKRGNAVFFAYAQAHPCSLSLHGGAPVIAGEKWVATKWLREGNFEKPLTT